MEDNISDFDGITPTQNECVICKLNIPDDLSIGNICKAENNYKLVGLFEQSSQQIFMFALIYSLMSIFVPALRAWLLYIIIVAFAPIMLINQIKLKLHYRGIPEINRIVHQLRMYRIRKDSRYYDVALSNTAKHTDDISIEYKHRIANELVDSVMMSHRFNPLNMVDDWAKAFNMTEEEFVEYLFSDTEIMDGLSIVGGSGLLPDVLSFVKTDTLRENIFDKLVEGCEMLDKASESERLYFIQDLYLVIEDIREELEKNEKWQIIIDVADSYEPEVPPKNQMSISAFKAQIEEMNRQQMANQKK